MPATGTLNFQWSQAMVAGFVAAGVTHAVISPGSRSTPLALAMLRQTGLICNVTVDERSAAFFALGIAKASQRPVLLLATSGTAPANWFPAVIEASQAGIPLILISADRPPELQGCGANQSIDQINLFGSHVRASHALAAPNAGFALAYLHHLAARVYEQATWPDPGPVHINQPFREPLIPQEAGLSASIPNTIQVRPPLLQPSPLAVEELAAAISGKPGLIICGELTRNPDFPEAVTQLAAQLDCPILAEPLSNLRFGQHERSRICVHYTSWLAEAEFHPEWVLRFGAFPVTRALQNLIAQVPIQLVIEPRPRWSDPKHQLTQLLRADPIAVCQAIQIAAPKPTPEGWQDAFAQHEAASKAQQSINHITTLIDELPENCPLFIGNSLAIRQLDTHSGSGEKSLIFYGNRGASGIDGNISTALGIAAIHGRVVALLGDLTSQHDLGGLALAQGRDAVIITVNNAGGGIFDLLPQASLPEFERGWRTPQAINFEHAALTFGLNYARAENNETFKTALHQAIQQGGPHLLELLTPSA